MGNIDAHVSLCGDYAAHHIKKWPTNELKTLSTLSVSTQTVERVEKCLWICKTTIKQGRWECGEYRSGKCHENSWDIHMWPLVLTNASCTGQLMQHFSDLRTASEIFFIQISSWHFAFQITWFCSKWKGILNCFVFWLLKELSISIDSFLRVISQCTTGVHVCTFMNLSIKRMCTHSCTVGLKIPPVFYSMCMGRTSFYWWYILLWSTITLSLYCGWGRHDVTFNPNAS